jgi:hypothetical protein
MISERETVRDHRGALCGPEAGAAAFERLASRFARVPMQRGAGELTERGAILITCGDQVCETDIAPLRTLADFCRKYLRGIVSGVQILSFFPYSRDDGFSVGAAQTGRNRTNNRQKLDLAALEAELAIPISLRAQVFGRYAGLMRARAYSTAFHPNGGLRVMPLGDVLFAPLRTAPDRSPTVLCLQDVSDRAQTARIVTEALGTDVLRDLITGRMGVAGRDGAVDLAPCETLWPIGEPTV